MSRLLRCTAGLAVASSLLLACSSGSDDTAPTTTVPATTTTAVPSSTEAPAEPTLDQVQLAVQEIARVEEPTDLAARPSSPDLFIAEKRGTIRRVEVTTTSTSSGNQSAPRYRLDRTPVLDLSPDVIDDGEQGLLGITFSTDGRRLYADYTAEPDGRTVVVEYTLGDSNSVDAKSRRVILEVEQPFANHNGGQVVMGRDGYLYVGLGDGGGKDDPDGNGQDPKELLGSILRIDPEGAEGDAEYAVPAGNPFADGQQGAPEVWLYGVRNPWRFSFDRANGDLWVADVGQGAWEEVTRLPAVGGFDAGRGANLGWDRVEGSHEHEGSNPPGGVLPIHEYSHDEGRCSITGGFVYRGSALPALQGSYLYADYCAPGLRAIQVDGGMVIAERTWDDLGITQAQSFGQDTDGELYVLLQGGQVLKLTAPARKR
ncbi:MAG TPA: PQQ-dependent sugar dehydrogenase [Acidimicrobiales bacterium]|nr:PQQ-dependent sugar dehydrogenase [Acidimicrobiales bacterium]